MKRYLWYFIREKTSQNLVSTLVKSLIDSGFSNIYSCQSVCVCACVNHGTFCRTESLNLHVGMKTLLCSLRTASNCFYPFRRPTVRVVLSPWAVEPASLWCQVNRPRSQGWKPPFPWLWTGLTEKEDSVNTNPPPLAPSRQQRPLDKRRQR